MIARFIPPILLAASLASPALAQSTTRPPPMLIHGNYCGPGNNAPLPPIDALDAACARHDACTPDGGLPTKACNLRLQREAALISRDPRQPEDIRSLAGLISVGASIMIADTGSRSTPASSVSHDILSPGTQWSRPSVDVPAPSLDGDDEDAE